MRRFMAWLSENIISYLLTSAALTNKLDDVKFKSSDAHVQLPSESSFLSASKPPRPFHEPALIFQLSATSCCWSQFHANAHACSSFMLGQVARAGGAWKQISPNTGPGLRQRSDSLRGTQSGWHRCSPRCQISDSCAFSKDSVFHPTCSPWPAHAAGTEAEHLTH